MRTEKEQGRWICTVHWNENIKAAKKREKEVAAAGDTGEAREALRKRKAEEEQAREEAERKRWEKARPAVVAALAAAVKKAPAGAGGVLGKELLQALENYSYGPASSAAKHVPLGKSAEDLVRHMAFRIILADTEELDLNDKRFVAGAKALGVDVVKIVEAAAPADVVLPKSKKGRVLR